MSQIEEEGASLDDGRITFDVKRPDTPAFTAALRDPVCGMDVYPTTAAGSSEHRKTTYFFCSAMCKQAFERDPSHYVG